MGHEKWSSPQTPRLILKKAQRETVIKSIICTVSVQDVYGKDMEIPEGYKFIAFRRVMRGEEYLTSNGLVNTSFGAADYFNTPRIIVTKA
jgi:hypothetical protein